MKKLILGTVLTASLAFSWDTEVPIECEGLLDRAIAAKGTVEQDATFNELKECIEGLYDFDKNLPTYVEIRE